MAGKGRWGDGGQRELSFTFYPLLCLHTLTPLVRLLRTTSPSLLPVTLAFSLHPSTPSVPLSVAPQQDTSMVWVIVPTPSVLSECVQAREREPSPELALVREAVLDRARRVMLAEGTVGRKREDVENYIWEKETKYM